MAIYDYGRTPEGVFYYAMEFLDGIDLQSLVDKNNRLLFHEIENGNLSGESLLKLLSLRPDFLRTPITKWDGRTEYWDSAYEIIKYETDATR